MRVPVDACSAAAMSLALALGLTGIGCHKKAESTAAPVANSGAEGEAQMPDDSDPLAQLAVLEGQMRALGLPTAADKQPAPEGELADIDAATVEQSEGDEGKGANEGRTEEAPVPTGAQVQPTPPTARDREANVCSDVCSLSESICELEVRICSLAEDHEGDSIYSDACERAVEDCEVAGEACDGCG